MEIRRAWLAGTLAKLGAAFLLGAALGLLFLMALFNLALEMWTALVPSLLWVPFPAYILLERLSSLAPKSGLKDFLLTAVTAGGLAACGIWLELSLATGTTIRSDWLLPVWFDIVFTLLVAAVASLAYRPRTRWTALAGTAVLWAGGSLVAYRLAEPVGLRWGTTQPAVMAVFGLLFLLPLTHALYQDAEARTCEVLNAALKWPLRPLYSILTVWNGPGPDYDV